MRQREPLATVPPGPLVDELVEGAMVALLDGSMRYLWEGPPPAAGESWIAFFAHLASPEPWPILVVLDMPERTYSFCCKPPHLTRNERRRLDRAIDRFTVELGKGRAGKVLSAWTLLDPGLARNLARRFLDGGSDEIVKVSVDAYH